MIKRLRCLALLLGLCTVAAPFSLSGAVFTVTSRFTSGPGSFHEMVAAAEATVAKDTIRFHLPLALVYGIALDSIGIFGEQLTHPVFIDGFSQPFSAYPQHLVTFTTRIQASWLSIGSSDVEIAGIAFANWGTALNFDQPLVPITEMTNVRIHDNAFYNTAMANVHMSQCWVHGIYFDHNYSRWATDFLYLNTCCGRMDSVFVRGNTVVNDSLGVYSQNACIQVEGYLHGVFSHFVVEDNVFRGRSYNRQSGISIRASAITSQPQKDTIRDIWIRRNQFLNDSLYPGTVGIELLIGPGGHVGDAEISDIHIEQNVFQGFRTGISIVNVSGDAQPSAIREAVIADNDFAGIDDHAMMLHAESGHYGPALIEGFDVHGNHIHHNRGTGIFLQGDWDIGQFVDHKAIIRDNVFAANHIHDNLGAGIHFYYSTPDTGAWIAELMGNTFTQNSIHGQVEGGIAATRMSTVLLGDSCELPTPFLTHVSPQYPFNVYGSLAATPGDTYRVEFFANPTAIAYNCCQAETYLGADTLVVPPNGLGQIAWPSAGSQPLRVSATATRLSDGTTGCISNFADTLTVGVLDPAAAAFQVFPNPHRGGPLWLQCNLPVSQIEIWNSLGQRLPCAFPVSDSPIQALRIGDQPAGVYHLRIQSEGRWYSRAFLMGGD